MGSPPSVVAADLFPPDRLFPVFETRRELLEYLGVQANVPVHNITLDQETEAVLQYAEQAQSRGLPLHSGFLSLASTLVSLQAQRFFARDPAVRLSRWMARFLYREQTRRNPDLSLWGRHAKRWEIVARKTLESETVNSACRRGTTAERFRPSLYRQGADRLYSGMLSAQPTGLLETPSSSPQSASPENAGSRPTNDL